MKPSHLIVVHIPATNIGISTINTLEIDIEHINRGLSPHDKKLKNSERSKFSELDIAQLFVLLDGYFLSPSGKKDDYLYFAQIIKYQKRNYMMVFCIDRHDLQTAGIITFYQIKESP